MKRILITGISGFVGHHLVTYFLSQSDYEVIGTYRSEASLTPLASIKDKLSLHQVDLMNPEEVKSVIASIKPDYIVHLAAKASAARSFGSPQETITNNIVSQLNILEALKEANMQATRLLVVSSGEIYGMVRQEDLPIDEDTKLRPVSPYSVSKLSQDFLSYQYFLTYKQDIVRVRPFNHTGPGQKEGFVVSDFAKQIVEIEKGKQEPIITVGNLDAKRDFTDVRDMVRAYHFALEKGISGEAYNLGSDKSVKISDILAMLLSLSTAKVEVKTDPTRFRPIDVPEIICDSSKFYNLTGWKPEIPLETTLKDILDYWRKIV